jgi:hypothetical protein
MELKRIDCKLTVCKVTEVSSINLELDLMMDGEVFAFKEFLIFH